MSNLQARYDALHDRLMLIRHRLEAIVCTEGCDAGVVYLSVDGPTRRPTAEEVERYGWNKDANNVYVHQYFSPLGDALMELWQLTGDNPLLPPDGKEEISTGKD